MILDLTMETWVSISVNQSSLAWVTLSPRTCLQLSTDICGLCDEGRERVLESSTEKPLGCPQALKVRDLTLMGD